MTIIRDRWGRALIPHPLPDGAPAPHKRPSSIAMKIADRFNLERWQLRMAVKGVAERPDLLALAHALDPDDADDKRQLDQVAKDAKEAAGSLKGANLGTALHSYIRQARTGNDFTPLPQYVQDIDAYQRLLDEHGIEPGESEQFCVWSAKQIAGTCDMPADLYDGRRVVMDLKTGQHNPAKFSMVEYAAQLSCYANATHTWDGVSAEPLTPVDLGLAYIVWLPAGQGHAELVEVDIAKGAAWVALALEVDAAQKDRQAARVVGPGRSTRETTGDGAAHTDTPGPAPSLRLAVDTEPASLFDAAPKLKPVLAALTDDLTQRIGQLRTRCQLLTQFTDITTNAIAAAWPTGTPMLTADGHTPETLDNIDAYIEGMEDATGLTVPSAEEIDAAIERLEQLGPAAFNRAEDEAKAAGIPNLRGPDIRRVHLYDLGDLIERIEAE